MISKLFKVVSFPFFRPWAFFSHIWCTRQWWSWMLFFFFHQDLFTLVTIHTFPPTAFQPPGFQPPWQPQRWSARCCPWRWGRSRAPPASHAPHPRSLEKFSDSWNFPKQTKYCPDRHICSPFATAAIRGVHPSLVLELRLEIEKITKLQFVDFSRDFVQSYMFICAVGAICFSLPGETIHCC